MLLTIRDRQRIEAIQALMDGRLTVAEAAQVLGRSERQVWRLLARAREDGLAGLLHAGAGASRSTSLTADFGSGCSSWRAISTGASTTATCKSCSRTSTPSK
jgi:hypothetical protein